MAINNIINKTIIIVINNINKIENKKTINKSVYNWMDSVVRHSCLKLVL